MTRIHKDKVIKELKMKEAKLKRKKRGRKKMAADDGDDDLGSQIDTETLKMGNNISEFGDDHVFNNKSMKIASAKHLNELIFSKQDMKSLGNRTVTDLRQRLRQKKDEQKRMAETMHPKISQTQTDSFNMRIIKNRILDEDTSDPRNKGAPLMPRDFVRTKSKMNFRKTQKKGFIVNRYRSQRNLIRDTVGVRHAPPPPLGKTFGHGLFVPRAGGDEEEDEDYEDDL